MKDFFVADAPRFENQSITSYFSLSSLSLRDRKGGGGQYLALTLTDKTGQLEGRMWEEFANVVETCAEGCYVKVQGLISKYNGKFQITLTRMRSACRKRDRSRRLRADDAVRNPGNDGRAARLCRIIHQSAFARACAPLL